LPPAKLHYGKTRRSRCRDRPRGRCAVDDRAADDRPRAALSDSAPAISVPIVNHDNNQHAANENLRLQNLWDGIELFARLFSGL